MSFRIPDKLVLEKCFPWKDHSVSSVEHTDNWKWLNKNGRDISELAKKKQCRLVSKLVLWLHNFVSYEWPEKKEQLACTLVIPPFTAFNTSTLFCLSFVDGYSRQYSTTFVGQYYHTVPFAHVEVVSPLVGSFCFCPTLAT